MDLPPAERIRIASFVIIKFFRQDRPRKRKNLQKKKFRALKQKLFFFMPRKKNSVHHIEWTFRHQCGNFQLQGT
jgi:hypothetical protein